MTWIETLTWPQAVAVHYFAFAITAGLAIHLLIRSRGHSLLGIFVLGLVAQVGLGYGLLPEFAERKPESVSEFAFIRTGGGLILFYCIASVFLLLGRKVFTETERPVPETAALSKPWLAGVIIIGLLFAVQRLTSPGGQMVLEEGLGTLGGDEYYSLRTELIFVDAQEVPSRILLHSMHLTRQAVTLCLLIQIGRFYRTRRGFDGVTAAVLFGITALDRLLRFQKMDLLLVVVICVAPLFVANMGFIRSRLRKFSLIAALGVVVFAAAALVVKTTQGLEREQLPVFVLERIFLVPPFTTSMHYEVYPNLVPHTWFGEFRLINALVDGTAPPAHGDISIDVGVALSGVAYNANACLIGSGWADAGYTGVLISALVLCLVCYAIDVFTGIYMWQVDFRPLVFYYWLCVFVVGNSSVVNTVVQCGLWFLPFFYVPLVGGKLRFKRSSPAATALKMPSVALARPRG